MRRRDWMRAAAWSAALASGLARAADPGVSARELLIGQSIALQDGKNTYGVEAQAGIAAAIDPVNADGGVFGRRLVLRTLDDANNSARAESHARQLVDAGVFMLFGSIEGGPSSAIAAVAEAAGVPFFGPMAGSPGLRRPPLRMVFPVRAEHRDEFRALIDWARPHRPCPHGAAAQRLRRRPPAPGEHPAAVHRAAGPAGLRHPVQGRHRRRRPAADRAAPEEGAGAVRLQPRLGRRVRPADPPGARAPAWPPPSWASIPARPNWHAAWGPTRAAWSSRR